MFETRARPDGRATGSPAWRGAFAVVLAGGMASATLPQFVYGVLAPFLLDEFDISRSRLGLLTTAGFLVGLVLSPPAGKLVDRLGGKRVFLGSTALTAIGLLLVSLVPAYGWMLVAAAILGLGFATANPMTNKLIAHHTSRGQQGLITGVKQSGVQFGGFLTGVSLPGIAGLLGWRGALALTAVIPAIFFVSCLFVVPADQPVDPGRVESESRLDPAVWWLSAYAFLMGAAVSVVSAYLPLYGREGVGLSVSMAGLVAGVVGFVGVVSRVVWSWGTERNGRFSEALIVLGAGAIVAIGLVLGASAYGAALLWIGAVVFGATAITWNAIGMLALIAEVGGGQAGRAAGYVLSGFYGGFVVAPPLFGYSVDATGGYTIGWVGVAALFSVATALAAVWHRTRRHSA